MALNSGYLYGGIFLREAATMNSKHFSASIGFAVVALFVFGCVDESISGSSGNGNVNFGDTYGDDLIGYKNANSANAAEADYSDQSASTASGNYTSAGPSAGNNYAPPMEQAAAGSLSYPATGGSGAYPMDAGTVVIPDAGIVPPQFDSRVEVPLDAGDDAETDAEIAAYKLPLSDTIDIDNPREPENPYFDTAQDPASTFSIDVDTGSYTLSRGYITHGTLPPAKSVRIEEFINYFHFHYKQPEGDTPFSLYTEMGTCPWNPQHDLVLLGIQGQEIEFKDQPSANLVFLIDVSGSMSGANKLSLLKKAFRMLVRQLREQDRVSIVTYAGQESVVLDSVSGDQKDVILSAIDRLESGGSTNGAGGIQKAYEIAAKNFMPEGNNRVLLATDGDFNVGISDTDALVEFIAEKRDSNVFLSVYGFGGAWGIGYDGNYQDEKMEQLADNGNGIYFYIDGPEEARRAFLYAISGSLLTIAKDVKVQVEFNPDKIKAYRLIGYENRVLANEDFSNDSVDAGELGAGLSVTALFELISADSSEPIPTPLPGTIPEIASESGESPPTGDSDVEQLEFLPVTGSDLVEVRIRYKDPYEQQSKLITERYDARIRHQQSSIKFLFASGVSEFAMKLRNSQYLDVRETRNILDQILPAKEIDREGAIAECQGMIEQASVLMGER